MSSLTSTALSHRPQPVPAWSPLKAALPDQAPQTPDPVPRSWSAGVPEDLSLRFEFNAITHAWMLAMTDARSGEVVRQIKVFNPQPTAVLHSTGQWVDRVV